MTFIILEGCDGAGKSTLAEAVIAELKYRYPDDEVEYLHKSQLERDPLDEYALDVEDYAPGSGKHIVADRWHWGELVYGPLYRDDSALTTGGFRWVELFLKARGATVWHVTASLETLRERLRVRGEDYLEDRDVEHVWRSFAAVSEKSVLMGGTADTTERTADELAAEIVSEAVWVQDRAAAVFRPEYIGPHLPHVLLVGEQQGNAEPGVTKAPFIARGKSSGTFFLESLPELWWMRVGIVNAKETDVKSLAAELFDPPVVALGLEASEAVDDQGVDDHSIVPHPQKIRRFFHKQQAEYGALLKTVSVEGGNKITWPK